MGACNHTDSRDCQNCAIPTLVIERRFSMRRATFIGSRLTPAFIKELARNQGLTDQHIAEQYPQLTVGQVRWALRR